MTGVKLPGVLVKLCNGLATLSNEHGEFRFPAQRAGEYSVRVGDVSRNGELEAGKELRLNLILHPAELGDIRVVVRDVDTGALIKSGIVVTLSGLDEEHERQRSVPGRKAKYEFDRVVVGRYRVAAYKIGYHTGSLEVSCVSGQTEEVEIELAARPLSISRGLVSAVASQRGLSMDAARTQAEQRFRQRHRQRLDVLDKAVEDSGVQRSQSFQGAELFIRATLTVAEPDHARLRATLDEVSQGLHETLGNVAANRRGIYRELLSCVCLGVLDRLTISHPQRLDAAARQVLQVTVAALRKAEVDLQQLRQAWDGTVLAEELGVQSVEEVHEVLR